MPAKELLKKNREEILRLANLHGALNLRVLGAAARGTDREDSDIDVLIDVGQQTTPWFPGGLIIDLEDLLGRSIDIATEASLHPAIRDRVLNEAIPL
ncbi:MAG: DNA polymerase subunit beta [Gemmatimonadetes bacterium]|nr:DNA polymerase subunit beta [Gemmatimonadota bacterium]